MITKQQFSQLLIARGYNVKDTDNIPTVYCKDQEMIPDIVEDIHQLAYSNEYFESFSIKAAPMPSEVILLEAT